MADPSKHYNENQLFLLALHGKGGKLSDDVSEHLADCPDCMANFMRMADSARYRHAMAQIAAEIQRSRATLPDHIPARSAYTADERDANTVITLPPVASAVPVPWFKNGTLIALAITSFLVAAFSVSLIGSWLRWWW